MRRRLVELCSTLGVLGVLLAPSVASASEQRCSVEVQSGDTLGAIARRHEVTEEALRSTDAQIAKRPDMLSIGQSIDVCKAKLWLRKHEREEARAQRRRSAKRRRQDAGFCEDKIQVYYHEVVPGEHLGQIAGRYGVRRDDIVRWNPALASNPDRLRVGQELRVCPQIEPRERKKITYVVASGDTLGAIAKRFSLTPRELERYQQGRLSNPDALSIGQKLDVWIDGEVVRGHGRTDTDTGVLVAGMLLPPGSNYRIKWKTGAWGTQKTIRVIQSAIAAYKRRFADAPQVFIGDISKKGGGKFPPHVSHQHGRDVDIGYVLKGAQTNGNRFRTANKSNLDVPRTWHLLKAFIDTNEVTYIFVDYQLQELLYEYAKSRGVSEYLLDELFQYPRGPRRPHGIIRHWKGHINHFHVRFRR